MATSGQVGPKPEDLYKPEFSIYALSADESKQQFSPNQSQIPSAFLPLQNAIARPGGNSIFAATPTERITHYTLLRKVVCKKGHCPLLIPPQETAIHNPFTGRVPPFLVISPPGCIATGKVSVSCGFISLTMGNSCLPFADSRRRHAQGKGQLFLRHGFGFAQRRYARAYIYLHVIFSLLSYSCPAGYG